MSTVEQYPYLFSSIEIGGIAIRNRVLQTAHLKLFSERGIDSERSHAYQVARAKGGVGLIIDGNRLIHPTSSPPNQSHATWGFDREGIAISRRTTSEVHEHGAKMFMQLNHFGTHGGSETADDLRYGFAPSSVRGLRDGEEGEAPKEMEPEDIREVTEWWARSAVYAREGGYDGVEIHIAHGYLLHEFFSPLYNKRTDEYGGSFENRLRFALEVLEEVRRQVGDDYVVGIRLVGSELMDGGLTIDDAVRAATELHGAVGLDFVSVSAASHLNMHLAISTADTEPGWLVEQLGEFKRRGPDIPMMVVGGIGDPARAEQVLAEGKADMIALTRAHIADPEFVNKVREGRGDEVYACIRSNQGCLARTSRALPMACTINPEAGREARFTGTMTPADPPREWLVVGGGPAGMKAAETLGKRGHGVTLVERDDRLGGQINLSVLTPGRERLRRIPRDLEVHMRKHGVRIELDTEATVDYVRELAPHGVIVATGATPTTTGFSSIAPLVERLEGLTDEDAVTVWDVLLERKPVGERVVLLDDDGTRYSAGTAEVLLDRGHSVEVVTRWPTLFPSTGLTMDMPTIYERVFAKGLTFRVDTWARRIDGNSLVVYNVWTRAETVLEGVDSVVLGTGPQADAELYFDLKRAGVENLHRIGDCLAPRRLDHAIYEGYVAGREMFTTEERFLDANSVYEPAAQSSVAAAFQE